MVGASDRHRGRRQCQLYPCKRLEVAPPSASPNDGNVLDAVSSRAGGDRPQPLPTAVPRQKKPTPNGGAEAWTSGYGQTHDDCTKEGLVRASCELVQHNRVTINRYKKEAPLRVSLHVHCVPCGFECLEEVSPGLSS